MRTERLLVGVAVLLALGGTGCGSSSSSDGGSDGGGGDGPNLGTTSGVSRTAQVAGLSPAEAATVCDWTNGKQGGYGRMATCTNGANQDTDPDKASCVDAVPAIGLFCPSLTVGDLEDCANATGTDLCAVNTAQGCANVRECFAAP